MKRCAVVNQNGSILNIMLSDPQDIPPDGCKLIPLKDDSLVDRDWKYYATNKKFSSIRTEKPEF